MSKVNQAWLNALATVELCEQRLAALHFAMKGIESRTKELSEECNRLHTQLCDNLNNAYRNIFMWGIVTNKPEYQKEARRIAFKKFLAEQINIMCYLELDNQYPGSWQVEEEEEFRKEIDELNKEE